ncbi:MAG TPA: CPBP family intramembrane glutamic endopeptidase [bacterium]|nr:CPBP family intramembrane glutamic endopeptidase [bacterium]
MRRVPAALWAIAAAAVVAVAVPLYLIVRPSRRSAWGLFEVAGVTLFFAGTLPLAGLLLPRAAAGGLPPFWLVVTLAVVQNAFFAAAGVYIVAVKYRLPLGALGLRLDHARRRLLQGAAASAAAVLGNFAGQSLTVFVLALSMGQAEASKYVNSEQQRSPIYRLLPQLHAGLDILVFALIIGVVVPIGEEIFFRGLALGALRRALNRHAAVVVSALFFALAHLQVVELVPILILGLVLGYLYDLTGSLIPGMIAHGLNNLAALLLFYQGPSIGS